MTDLRWNSNQFLIRSKSGHFKEISILQKHLYANYQKSGRCNFKIKNSCSWGSCSKIPVLYFGVSTTYISSICFDQTCKKAFPAWPTVYVCHILGILHLRKFCIMDIKIILRKDHLTKILFGINPLSKCN